MTFKKINVKETIFHYIELDAITVVLFDSMMDLPIAYGSKNKVGLIIKNFNKSVRVNYYGIDNNYIKLEKVYDKR